MKMRITNKLNLPAPLVRAVTFDDYEKGDCDFTVTELLKPPRARVLIKQHQEELEEDASERLWALMGKIGHLILERAAKIGDSSIVERRFYCSVGTYTIGGRADLIMLSHDSANLVDYKFCSVWTTTSGIDPDWEAQVNMLAWLAAKNGVTIKEQSIVAIFRDWSKPRSHRERDYPKTQVLVIPVPVWTDQQTSAFIATRINAHIAAETELPLCTNDERWATKETWALMKHGNKRASKLFTEEAKAHAALPFVPRSYIEHRAPEYKRCTDYCAAYRFCTQAQGELGDQG